MYFETFNRPISSITYGKEKLKGKTEEMVKLFI